MADSQANPFSRSREVTLVEVAPHVTTVRITPVYCVRTGITGRSFG